MAMDPLELLRQLEKPLVPEVKEELPDEYDESVPMPTGMAVMHEEMQAEQRRDAEEERRVGEFMMREETWTEQRRRRGQPAAQQREEKEKTPLTTFGHSSRPRRSVNYASIERGDETQPQDTSNPTTTQRKRAKRTRDDLDENYEQEQEGAPPTVRRRRPPPVPRHLQNMAVAGTSSRHVMVPVFSNAPEEFQSIAPKPDGEKPQDSERERIGNQMAQLPALRRASGGFRRFAAWFTDGNAAALMDAVKRRCNMLESDNFQVKYLQSMRHVYNTLPTSTRRAWEREAKKDIFDSNKILPIEMSMPLSEIYVRDVTRESSTPRNDGLRINCCPARPVLGNSSQFMEHYLQHHDITHMFGCDICERIFASRFELNSHDCPEFARHLSELVLQGKTLVLNTAYMFICCTECGLWLPLKFAMSKNKGWNYFATALENHMCQPLAVIAVYYRQALKTEGKGARLRFNMIPYTGVNVPLSCAEHDIDEFESYEAMEEHFKTLHLNKDYICQRCDIQFGTEFAYQHHIQKHVASSTLMGNYLLYSATFEPPPGSGRQRHVGHLSEIPTVGGFWKGQFEHIQMSENRDSEFVEPFENTTRRKLLIWKSQKSKKENRTAQEGTSSASSFELESGEDSDEETFQATLKDDAEKEPSSSEGSGEDSEDVTIKKVKGDMGYEHIDRDELFKQTEIEVEARKLLNKVFQHKVVTSKERIQNPEEILEKMKDAVPLTLPNLPCKFAEKIAQVCMRNVSLPAGNCIEPVKDYVLVNKIYTYCSPCKSVYSDDITSHASSCPHNATEDQMVEVFHGASGPQTGVKCIYEDCTARLCSVFSLGTHVEMYHKKRILIKDVVQTTAVCPEFTDERYDKDILTLAKYYTNPFIHERNHLTKMTNVDCYLPLGGFLTAKAQPRVNHAALRRPVYRGPLVRKEPLFVSPVIRLPIVPAPAQRGPPALGSPGSGDDLDGRLSPLGTDRIKAYKVPRTTRWYRCSWCSREYELFEPFIDHLVNSHSHHCNNCGKCYSSSNTKRTHYCLRLHTIPRSEGKALIGSCPSCHELIAVDAIYIHMLRRHFSTIEYMTTTGEMFPQVEDFQVRELSSVKTLEPGTSSQQPATRFQMDLNNQRQLMGNIERLRTIRPGPPVYGVGKEEIRPATPPKNAMCIQIPHPNSIEMRFMCYLCELTFCTDEELAEHLEVHPEKWTTCPFCNQGIQGHYDLQRHIMSYHVVKISGALCCAYCHEHHRFMTSHMLFRCKKQNRCTICGQKSGDANANRVHIIRTHNPSLRRFQCTFCDRTFVSVGEFYEHGCNSGGGRLLSCVCHGDKFFQTAGEYCDHYDSVHIRSNTCKVCMFEASSQEDMIRHRMTHLMLSRETKDAFRLYVLVVYMYPKPHSGYMKWLTGEGRIPKSFEKEDRSKEYVLMGNPAPLRLAGLKSYTSPPQTIADALEGLNTRSPQIVQRSPAQLRLPVKTLTVQQCRPSTSNEVVVLSDDDNDDIMVVEHNGSPSTSTANGHHLSAPKRLSDNVDRPVTVRVEKAHDGYRGTGSSQPGYIANDDDVEVTVDVGKDSKGQPIVRAIVDEDGDDELEVIAEVEHAVGTLPSSIAPKREKKFNCSQCSLSFLTNSSLQEHEKNHKQDAGHTISAETYGLPDTTKVGYICRNCCIVFENYDTYRTHMKIHGDTSLNCVHCSGIAFNASSLIAHMNAHEKKSNKFDCSSCKFEFKKDLELFDHLFMAHNMKLFFFCKICGYGSTCGDTVFNHIATNHRTHAYTLVQRFGACPVNTLNYTPDDEIQFRALVVQKKITLAKPSDCSHRSLLLTHETLVTCHDCFCTQTWFNYLACNGMDKDTGNTPAPVFKPIELTDSRKDFALFRQISDANAEHMVKHGNQNLIHQIQQAARAPPQRIAPKGVVKPATQAQRAQQHRTPQQQRPGPQQMPHRVAQQNAQAAELHRNQIRGVPPDLQHFNNMGQRQNLPPPPHRQQFLPQNHMIAPVVQMNARGMQHLSPQQQQQMQHFHHLQQQQHQYRMQQEMLARRAAAQQQQQPRAAGAPARVVQAMMQQASQATEPTRNQLKMTTNCKYKDCPQVMYSEFDRQLHTMHTSPAVWFCRLCGQSFRTEPDIIQHYTMSHVKPAWLKFRADDFKPYVLKLKCPIPSCQSAEFHSTKPFEHHMNRVHAEQLPHESQFCDARFATEALRDRHEKSHNDHFKTHMARAQCCAICGTLDLWTLPKEVHCDCIQSHLVRHGLNYRSSCRHCLKQFVSDTDQRLAVSHVIQEHTTLRPDGKYACDLCMTSGFEAADFETHVRQHHVFHVLCKGAHSVRGEYAISADEEYERYVGLRGSRVMTSSVPRPSFPSTSGPAPPPISSQHGGNAALQSLAAMIRDPPPPQDDDVMEIDD